MEETLDAIKRSKTPTRKNRYNSAGESPKLLSEIVNPSIIKLTENEHKKGMGNLGPFDSPEHNQALVRSEKKYLTVDSPMHIVN